MRAKHDIVWRALMVGLTVEIGDQTCKLIDGELCFDWNGNWHYHTISLNIFIKQCNQLTDEEATIIVMNTTLNKSKIQERKKRTLKNDNI